MAIKRTVEVGTVVLHNVGANIQAKQMSHFLAEHSLWRKTGTSDLLGVPLYTLVFE